MTPLEFAIMLKEDSNLSVEKLKYGSICDDSKGCNDCKYEKQCDEIFLNMRSFLSESEREQLLDLYPELRIIL